VDICHPNYLVEVKREEFVDMIDENMFTNINVEKIKNSKVIDEKVVSKISNEFSISKLGEFVKKGVNEVKKVKQIKQVNEIHEINELNKNN